MNAAATGQPDYGNWVGLRLIRGVAVLGLVVLVGAVASFRFGVTWLFIVLLVVAALLAAVAAYFAWARHALAANGGDVQGKVQELVLDRLEWDGRGAAIDIGCGNGPLTMRVARAYPHATVTGIDFWGASWEYSQAACEANAAREGVGERVSFRRASASALPYPDGQFDAAVSNLCFHEVRDARDKRAVVREALRVLKPGGAFAFQDLFALRTAYGEIDDLLAAVRGWGVAQVEYVDTSKAEFIPPGFRLPFMVGPIGILHGRK
jgi:SAM-dependent methyltransferase